MEEARQHTALGLLGWLGVAAYATFMLGALVVLITVLSGVAGRAVPLVAPVMCIAAATMSLLATFNALRSGNARWGRRFRFSRSDRPFAFALMIFVNVAVFVANMFVFILLIWNYQ